MSKEGLRMLCFFDSLPKAQASPNNGEKEQGTGPLTPHHPEQHHEDEANKSSC